STTKEGESSTVKKLIKELKDDSVNKDLIFASQLSEDSYTYLYKEIVKAEADNDIASQKVLNCYFEFGRKLSDCLNYYKNEKNIEIKQTERARKIYELFIKIGVDKMQQNTLDDIWNKQFIQAGKELLDLTLREAFESKVNLEHAKSNLYSFWQEVITERLQLQVQITYEKETLLTFDESDKFFGRQLRLPYNKEATSSDDKRAFNSTLDSDLIFPVGAKKIKSCKGDVNVKKANGDSAIKITSTALCHSFLIDSDDKNYIQQGIFTREELEEIKNFSKKELLLVPDDLLKYLNSFRKSFIDKAFLDIEGMEIVRGELCSYALSNKKNLQRVVASTDLIKRKAIGQRGDLIIQKWHTEYGCSKAGKIFERINDTKIIKEGGLKMPKMLRDMFIDLCKTMEMWKNKIRRLETVGLEDITVAIGFTSEACL
ncbi:16169_t:CDS:10, partial [Dentiscutata erythropus]